MKTIPLSELIIPARQRQHFEEKSLNDLSTSIRTKGLLHPVVLQNDNKTLVAGERRTRAIQLLYQLSMQIQCDGELVPANEIPYITIGELTTHDLVEVELEENLLREDLTWQEEANAIAALHKLRLEQTDGKQSMKDTALEINPAATAYGQNNVREALILNERLDDPDVLAAKSKKEAIKIIKRKASDTLNANLAAQFDVKSTPHLFSCGDFRDHMDLIATSSIDIILTDPPYGIGADEFGTQAGNAHAYNDSPAHFASLMKEFVAEASRVVKEKAHAYIFCDPRRFDFLFGLFGDYGWDVFPTPIIWNKGTGMLPLPEHGPRRCYETILFANRGKKETQGIFSDVITIPALPKIAFAAEKPAELYENLLARSARPGTTVWDPFTGTGPIFPAANRASCRVIATELIEEKFNHAKLRLNES